LSTAPVAVIAMKISSFDVAALPRIAFGSGRIQELPGLVPEFGRRVLVITGRQAFRATSHWSSLLAGLTRAECEVWDMSVEDEPSPQLVDAAVTRFRPHGIEVVVGVGGGSVLDAAKAIAGLLPFGNSVLDHLEGVGRGVPYRGPALPFIAVPTTAGTGSEATKNAVLSVRGEGGYKKSFRHDTLVPRLALVDPELLASCSAEQIAANGMDAFTQLLESYVSLNANPLTDALAWSGLKAVREHFLIAWRGGNEREVHEARAAMAYGSLLSGITLAQVGLGSVHGLASPLGALFPIPHGVVCGTLVAAATETNIGAMRAREPQHPALGKYAAVGRLMSDHQEFSEDEALQALVEQLQSWTITMGLARLGRYGVRSEDIGRIVADSRGSSMKTNPIVLEDEEIARIVEERL